MTRITDQATYLHATIQLFRFVLSRTLQENNLPLFILEEDSQTPHPAVEFIPHPLENLFFDGPTGVN